MTMIFKCEILDNELNKVETTNIQNIMQQHIKNCSYCSKDIDLQNYLSIITQLKKLPKIKTNSDFVFKLEKNIESFKQRKKHFWRTIFNIPTLSFALIIFLVFMTNNINNRTEALSHKIKISQIIITQKMLKPSFRNSTFFQSKLQNQNYFKNKTFMYDSKSDHSMISLN